MKKVLFGILTFLGVGLSFCNASGITGIYHNSSLGLISIVVNGTTEYTLSDKNLGATCTDLNQSCSYGNFFQWGNNYPFTSPVNFVNSYNLDLSNYGPGNYFNSNGSFYSRDVYSNSNGFSSNMWGYVDGTYESMQGPCPDGFHLIDSWTSFKNRMSSVFLISNGSDYSEYLFFPFPGYIGAGDGNLVAVGSMGYFWSSKSAGLMIGESVESTASSFNISNESMGYGFSVRCFKNSVVEPDFSWSILKGDPLPVVSTITVNYNGNDSINVVCSSGSSITINGLSTITSTNTFTPYYNISYKDEDNQSLTESYSKDNLYLSGGLFKKTYTGNNERILTDITESANSSFSGYLPTFDITGGINDVSESGNIFNNFAENSVKFTLSNIPSYIQYVILLFILFFILGFIRKFRRK